MTRVFLRDLCAVASAALLVLTAVLVGRHIQDAHRTLFVHWPPLFAEWDPHVGPGTPAALAVAVAVVAYGPSLAGRLSWRAMLLSAWAASLAWTWSLALVDGWQRGVAGRLTTTNEYLRVVDRFHDIPAALSDFTRHIVWGTPDPWPAHIAGHPPAATVTFVLLDHLGLRGGGWAGAWCITVGSTACVAVLLTVGLLAGRDLARRAAPFMVLAPAAVWVGTSADGYFAAVAAWSVALLALAVRGAPGAGGRAVAAFGAGLLFGLTCYLSYGLTLFALIGAAVLLLGAMPGVARRAGLRGHGPAGIRPAVLLRGSAALLAGLAVVPLVFTLAGFDWWEGYRLLVTRYYQGVGGTRPYGYWVWANLACTVFIAGFATAAGLGRAGAALVRDRADLLHGRLSAAEARLAVLVFGALLALLVADLSGMSKAETERIWVPFALWLLPSCALLTRPRAWLTAQALLALLVNHLLLTGW
ncbi:hypothetical protein [Streptomyces sp. NPDC086787]|uniref:hypothetical protein n=1 Tax=Streptomyces sp. NPDC086787 TaxID=3365759 RepID=UPI003813D638